MKASFAPLGFALGASAALVPRDQCCFSLTASGGKSGAVGQLSDGQNRVGQTGGLATQSATYCLNNGGLTDQNGRGCILTPPTTQFQCDSGASPTTGFAVDSNGDLTYNDNTQLYACSTGDNGGSNIYTTTNGAQTGCVQITLNTGGKCAGSGGSGSSSAPASSAPAASQSVNSAGSSAGASSAPAASQPASSAGASSAPAASQPPSSAGASSAPAASQPANSAPAASYPGGTGTGSAPAGPQTHTVYSTTYQTITSCEGTVSSCPAQSTVTNTGSVPVVVTSQHATSAANYACNPAHSYPNGATCISTGGSLTLVTSTTQAASAPASSTPTNSPGASSASSGVSSAASQASSVVSSAASQASSGASSVASVASSGVSSAASHASSQASSALASSASAPQASSASASSAPAGSAHASSPSSAPAASQPASSAGASSAPAASQPATGTSNSGSGSSACPTSLTGAYQTPHAIIPINKDQPSKSYGTQYNAYISSSNSTIFNFDIPQSYSGKQCSVIFLFPQKSQLETSSFTQSGSGGLKFDQLSSVASMSVTYASAPGVGKTLNSISSVAPGNSYLVSTGSCQVGTQSIEISSTGGYNLQFFEDWNPSPIGLFVTSC